MKPKTKNPHARYSPSMLEHLEVCPGYEKESGTNIFAQEGEMMHKACETGKLDDLNPEQLGCVKLCLNYIDSLFDDGIKAGLTVVADLKEVKLDVEGLTWGTADRLIIWSNGFAELIDFKFGRNPVEDAENNLQGQCYALGALHKYQQIKRLKTHFLLPRRDEVTTHEFFERGSGFEAAVRLRISSVIARRKAFEQDPFAHWAINPRVNNCLYCGAKGKCQPLHTMAFKIAKKYDETFEIPEEVHSSQIQDPKEMAKAKTIATIMKRWCESVDEHALQMVLSGTEIPGWELKNRMGKLRISNAQAAYMAASEIVPVTMEEFLTAAVVTKTALDELVSSKSERGTKAENVRQLNSALAELGVGVRDQDTKYLGKIKE